MAFGPMLIDIGSSNIDPKFMEEGPGAGLLFELHIMGILHIRSVHIIAVCVQVYICKFCCFLWVLSLFYYTRYVHVLGRETRAGSDFFAIRACSPKRV